MLRGGAASGKSYAAAQYVVLRCLSETGHRYLVTRKVARMLKDSVIHDIMAILNLWGIAYNRVKAPPEIYLPESQSTILFYGLDDPDKLKSISQITSVWMEEADQYTESDYLEMDRRLRPQNHRAEILATFNPVSKKSDIYRLFYEAQTYAQDTLSLTTTYKDNPYCPPATAKAIEALKDVAPMQYEVYALGRWGITSGNIYGELPKVDKWPSQPKGRRYFGVDYGYNNPTAIVEVQEHDGLYYIREHMYASGKQHNDVVAAIKALNTKNDPVFVDPSASGLIAMMSSAGVNAKKANNDVQAGIGFVQSITPKLRSLESNLELQREWDGYQWQTDRHGNVLDSPVKFRDHICDGLRYALYSSNLTPSAKYMGKF